MSFKHSYHAGGDRKSRALRSVLLVPVLSLMVIIGVLATQFAGNFTHAANGGLVPFPGTISPLVAHSKLDGPANVAERISLSIGLRPRNQAALAQYVQDVTNPSSVNFRRYLSPAQVADVFGPGKETYNAVVQYLQASGFSITHTYNHRLLVSFSGTVGQAEQTFHVTINTYTAPDGRVFYSNAVEPSIPASIAALIQSIGGLSDASYWRHPPVHLGNQIATRAKINTPAKPNAVSCPSPGTGTGNAAAPSYLIPSQIAGGYNLNGLYNAGYRGEGQTVALFELDSFQGNDLSSYTSCFGNNTHAVVQTVTAGQNPISTDGGVLEVELDAELVLSAAPQLGVLRIYEAANDVADYNAEWARIIQDAPPVVSTSWGQCEQAATQQEAVQENTFFTVAAAQGESIFAASGDSGSAGCAFDGLNPPFNGLNAGDPAAQPFVTGVGGTNVSLSGGSAYSSETTWNDAPQGTFKGGASGGGISQFWQAPAWQSAPGVNNTYSTNTICNAPAKTICREAPDVSLNADPYNGYAIYCSSTAAGCASNGGWYPIGGTSAAAPMWAAMMALTNEMSVKMGGFNIGFVNPLLYQIGSSPGNYAASFHDIAIGNNDYNSFNGGKYPAAANYDLATGLGSYNAFNLATQLVSLAQTATGPRSSPVSNTWYFAEGSVGGGFQEFLTLQNPSATQSSTVNVTYLFQAQAAVVVSHVVPFSTRYTINVNQDLNIPPSAAQQPISAIVQVTSGPGIVAERPMYFNFKGIQSGTDAIGATAPGKVFYFPEADTRQTGRNYYTYITMLNPSSTATANVTVTFYTGTCGQSGQPACTQNTVQVLPLHRGTVIPPFGSQMAITVTTDLPLVIERPMYFRDSIATAGGNVTGAASEVGATAPGKEWLFAEGYTGPNFQEYLVLANFGTTAVPATITLEYTNGSTQAIPVTVPALGQLYFDVNQANANPSGTCTPTPCATTQSVSADVTSTGPIVADRLMYFHYGPTTNYSGGTDAVGQPGPASQSVYAFAEGYTANTFQEYLTLQNPTANDETVAVTLFADGYVLQQQLDVKAHSRQTLGINGLVVPIAQAYNNMGANSYAVSMSVQALGKGSVIVAERPMYFDFYGDQGGTDVIGFTG